MFIFMFMFMFMFMIEFISRSNINYVSFMRGELHIRCKCFHNQYIDRLLINNRIMHNLTCILNILIHKSHFIFHHFL